MCDINRDIHCLPVKPKYQETYFFSWWNFFHNHFNLLVTWPEWMWLEHIWTHSTVSVILKLDRDVASNYQEKVEILCKEKSACKGLLSHWCLLPQRLWSIISWYNLLGDEWVCKQYMFDMANSVHYSCVSVPSNWMMAEHLVNLYQINNFTILYQN